MKKLIFILTLICMAGMTGLKAQMSYADYQDVVYLKNGSMIKGIIIEQIPGKTIKIKTADGSEFVYGIMEVEKFAKEPLEKAAAPIASAGTKMACCSKTAKTPREFYSKPKGYFGQVQIAPGIGAMGIRVVNGYKFGRFGYVGLGVGVDRTMSMNRGPKMEMIDDVFPGNSRGSRGNGWQAPIFIHYEGDVLKRRVTPTYFVELGYSIPFIIQENYFRSNGFQSWSGTHNRYGSVYSSLGLGVKVRTRRRANVFIGLDWKLYAAIGKTKETYYPDFGSPTTTERRDFNITAAPGLRVNIGF